MSKLIERVISVIAFTVIYVLVGLFVHFLLTIIIGVASAF